MTPEPHHSLSVASEHHSSEKEVEMYVSNIDHSLLQWKDGGREEERAIACVKMLYSCCQCLWLETDKLHEPRAPSLAWMVSGRKVRKGGKRQRVLLLLPLFVLQQYYQALRLHILSTYCEHLYKGQDRDLCFSKWGNWGRFDLHKASRPQTEVR